MPFSGAPIAYGILTWWLTVQVASAPPYAEKPTNSKGRNESRNDRQAKIRKRDDRGVSVSWWL